jgi:hypothetical protein
MTLSLSSLIAETPADSSRSSNADFAFLFLVLIALGLQLWLARCRSCGAWFSQEFDGERDVCSKCGHVW